MVPTTLLTMAGNVSTAFLASLFSASANLSNHFFKIPSSFDGEPPTPQPPPRAHVMASTIDEMVIQRAGSIENMIMPCSRNKV